MMQSLDNNAFKLIFNDYQAKLSISSELHEEITRKKAARGDPRASV